MVAVYLTYTVSFLTLGILALMTFSKPRMSDEEQALKTARENQRKQYARQYRIGHRVQYDQRIKQHSAKGWYW